jgi:hypothetical protein
MELKDVGDLSLDFSFLAEFRDLGDLTPNFFLAGGEATLLYAGIGSGDVKASFTGSI